MKKLLYFLFPVSVLFASNNKREKPPDPLKTQETLKVSAPVLAQTPSSKTRYEPYQEPAPPKDISFNIDSLKILNYGSDSLKDQAILYTLFPAPTNEEGYGFYGNYSTSMAYWKSSSCQPQAFPNQFICKDETQYDTLPYERNYTRVSNKIYYRDKNAIQFCMFSFSTAPDNPAIGRYFSGLLSIAVFKKDSIWRLIEFNPFVNYQGTYSTATPPDSIILLPDNSALFVIKGGLGNGWYVDPYAPYESNLYFISSVNCKNILEIPFAYCWNEHGNFGSEWHSDVYLEADDCGETLLKIITTGYIEKKNFEQGLLEALGIPKETYKSMPKEFRFNISYYYSIHNGRAALAKTERKLNYRKGGRMVTEDLSN